MLIKPLIKNKVSTNSLPVKSGNPQSNPAYFGIDAEKYEFLELTGKLMMLPIMYHEWNLKQNKIIHDFNCVYTWPVCECNFANSIRREDIRILEVK